MNQPDSQFKQDVQAIVAQIPRGRVINYGSLAALAGQPAAARIVGGIAHFGDPDLPWQRVVMKDGGLASGYPGGLEEHKQVLQAEGIEVSDDYKVNIKELLWLPPDQNQNSLL